MSQPLTDRSLAAIVRDGPPPLSDADVDGIYAVGADLYARERWSEAMDVFRLLVLVRPTNAKAWIALGACHEAQGDDERAVSLYRVASCATSRADARSAQLYLAAALAKKRHTAEAREILDTLLPEDGDSDAFMAMFVKARATVADQLATLETP